MTLIKRTFLCFLALAGISVASSAQVHAVFPEAIVEKDGNSGGNMAGSK